MAAGCGLKGRKISTLYEAYQLATVVREGTHDNSNDVVKINRSATKLRCLWVKDRKERRNQFKVVNQNAHLSGHKGLEQRRHASGDIL